jgi:hypothetical protein
MDKGRERPDELQGARIRSIGTFPPEKGGRRVAGRKGGIDEHTI